ncbi:MAG: response regulator [Caldithrix sp.]|nr:response regulator [Caldithrix sp.]
MSKRILIIEDDKELTQLLDMHLQDLDLEVEISNDGREGLSKALEQDYNLIILDIMLPGIEGTEICRRIREKRKVVPILMLTARTEELDKVLGLELGADDYITKPFSIRELQARVKAMLRRMDAVEENSRGTNEQKELDMGKMKIYIDKRKVFLNDKQIELTAKEFDLLALFASNPGKAYTREELLNIVWGYQYTGYEHTVNSHINRLRAKIEDDPSQPLFIKTVWGVGYQFAELEELNV